MFFLVNINLWIAYCKTPERIGPHPRRENNCQEQKKETEDKIQTLVSDHKAKVRKKKRKKKVLSKKSAARTNGTLASDRGPCACVPSR